MLIRPEYAYSHDRTIKAETHETAGEPERWFSNQTLEDYELFGFSFNFFINWNRVKVSPEVWVMRIATSEDDISDLSNGTMFDKIVNCDGEEYLRKSAAFFGKNNLIYKYIIFQDSDDWENKPNPIVQVTIGRSGDVIQVKKFESLVELMSKIKLLSGGPVKIGNKGLRISTSALEAYLSKTDSLYPGDMDLLILNHSGEPVAILEYKKHTKDHPIEEETLSNYYPKPDARKYNRIVMFRNKIMTELPIVVVFYPTKPHIESVKLELIDGRPWELRTIKSKIVPLPTIGSVDSYKAVFNEILEMIK